MIESENWETEWKIFLVITQRTVCMLDIYSSFFFLVFYFFGGNWVGSVEGILSIVLGGEDSKILAPCGFFLKGSLTFLP